MGLFSSEEGESHDEQDVYDHKPVGHGFLLILLVLLPNSFGQSGNGQAGRNDNQQNDYKPVSYTHLTLPTIYSV